jgi:choice-of-anchor B domain-containing protein
MNTDWNNLQVRPSSSHRWWLVSLGMAGVLGLLLGWVMTAIAHEGAKSPPLSRLPACRVATTTCSLSELSRRDFGVVRVFPLGAKRQSDLLGLDGEQIREELEPLYNIPCTNGFAEIYPCKHIDLLAFLPVTLFGDLVGNTLWGWTDRQTGREYVIAGVRNGTVFIDISQPTAPRYLGKLPSHSGESPWRDMKVYQNYAYIVSDFNPRHGMQVFDLTHLRTLTATTPVTLSEIAHYAVFSNSHNLVINEASGFAYAVGSETCQGGLHMLDLRTPTEPTFAGCYGADGYVHDAQCLIYAGPDPAYQGREICFNANGDYQQKGENQVAIVDVTDKTAPVGIAILQWGEMGYAHQSWLTADHRYLLLDDELDELEFHHNARTYVFDVGDLDQPRLIGHYTSRRPSVDHNLYISGTYVYQANYTAGLRILDLQQIASAALREVAYFDTYPGSDQPEFTGAWSPYPFFASGVVAVSTIDRGLFLLKPQIPANPTDDQYLFLPNVVRDLTPAP